MIETSVSRYDFGGAPTSCSHIVAYVVSHSILLISKAIDSDPMVLGEKLTQIKFISGVDMLYHFRFRDYIDFINAGFETDSFGPRVDLHFSLSNLIECHCEDYFGSYCRFISRIHL